MPKYNTDDIVDLIEEAVVTLRALPCGGRRDPDLDLDDEDDEPLPRPTPAAIDRLDMVLEWMSWLPTGYVRRLVWARGAKIRWKHLVERFGRSRSSLCVDHAAAIRTIHDRLIAASISPDYFRIAAGHFSRISA